MNSHSNIGHPTSGTSTEHISSIKLVRIAKLMMMMMMMVTHGVAVAI
jgi:hypothetical protein